LPVFEEELRIHPVVENRLQSLRESVSQLESNEAMGDPGSLRKHVAFDIENVDQDMGQLFAINRRQAMTLVERVNDLGHRSILWSVALDLLSIVITIVAGGLLLSVTGRYERMLSERADELDQFAGRVAHDILSPLSSVGMSIDLAERTSPAE